MKDKMKIQIKYWIKVVKNGKFLPHLHEGKFFVFRCIYIYSTRKTLNLE